ncbi:MAG: threonine--tRNA ligase, partial [Spirochaetaceae bacterium]|nr:threonine--tRNA ligase [Spirochaetaceae bacterium]
TDFGFGEEKIIVRFSTRPEMRVGDDETWDRAEAALSDACKQAGLSYELAPGEGAFYGPKLEFTLIDAMGRLWQCGTLQVDYQLPSKERLNAEYVGEDNSRHTPVMLHRAILGSLERFIGILLENCAGALPPWLHFNQVQVIPVAPPFNDYAQAVADKLKAAGLRVEANVGTDRMNAKIRTAQNLRIPYMLVVGQQEAETDSAAIRFRDGRKETMKLDDFIVYIKDKIASRSIEI